MNTQNPVHLNITPLIQAGEGSYHAIRQTGTDEFTAFICSNRGNVCLGTFKTKAEADAAINDAEQARWHG